EPPELVDRLLDHSLRAGEVGDVLAICGCLAACGFDLLDDLLRRCGVLPLAGERRTEVVDDHVRAGLGECERVRAADAAAGPGDDRDLARETRHVRENTRPGRGAHRRSYRVPPAAAMSGCQTQRGR